MSKSLITTSLLSITITGLLCATMIPVASAQSEERLAQLLKKYPDADANGDGKLTREEALRYRKAMRDKKGNRKGQKKQQQAAGIKPTHADVAYGPDKRNTLDLWLAKSDTATPLVINIHGGGFKSGDKSSFHGQAGTIRRLNDANISVASINYRLTDGGKNPFPAAMDDAARAIQFLRYHAKDYNLDKPRFGAIGGSAGGCTLMWIGFHPDMAKPDSKDPVLRESTRLQFLAPSSGQSCVHIPTLRKWFNVENLKEHSGFRPLFGLPLEGEIELTDKLDKMMLDASPITYLTKDDPPIYLTYRKLVPITAKSGPGVWVHHPIMGIKLKEQMDALGIECHISIDKDTKGSPYKDNIEFLIAKMGKGQPAK